MIQVSLTCYIVFTTFYTVEHENKSLYVLKSYLATTFVTIYTLNSQITEHNVSKYKHTNTNLRWSLWSLWSLTLRKILDNRQESSQSNSISHVYIIICFHLRYYVTHRTRWQKKSTKHNETCMMLTKWTGKKEEYETQLRNSWDIFFFTFLILLLFMQLKFK